MSDVAITLYGLLNTWIGDDVVAIYANALPPDATFPCSVYGQIYGGDGVNVSGGTGSTYRMRFQVDLFHASFAGLMSLRSAVLNGLHLYSGNGIINTRIDLDIPYTIDELDLEVPAVFRHIIDISFDTDRSVA